MSDLIIAAITGPTGAGKSTVSHELSKQLPRCVNIDVDQVKHFIVSDFRYEDGDDGLDQWRLLGKNIGMLAANFHGEGYNVIINGYLRQSSWEEIESYVQLTDRILLMPAIDVVVQRDEDRDEVTRMGGDAVKDHYAFFSTDNYADFTKIDSSQQSRDETVSEILGYIYEQKG